MVTSFKISRALSVSATFTGKISDINFLDIILLKEII